MKKKRKAPKRNWTIFRLRGIDTSITNMLRAGTIIPNLKYKDATELRECLLKISAQMHKVVHLLDSLKGINDGPKL